MLKQSATFSLYVLSIPYFKLSTLMNNFCVCTCMRPRMCAPRVCVPARVCACLAMSMSMELCTNVD